VQYTTFVQMLRSDRSVAITALFEQHGEALYDYSLTLLGDRLEAGSALHDAILVGIVRSDRLRRRTSFVPWLYALVRHEADRRQRRDAVRVLHAKPSHESRWRAASSGDGAAAEFDQEHPGVLDLVFRHRFTVADVAAVLGIGSRHARQLVAQARAAGAPVAADHDTAPFAPLPPGLLAQVLESAADAERMSLLAVPIERLDRSGFPVGARHRAYRRPVIVVAVAVLVLLFATAGVLLTDNTPARQQAGSPGAPESGAQDDGPRPANPASLSPQSPPSAGSTVSSPATLRPPASPTPSTSLPASPGVPSSDPVPDPPATGGPVPGPTVAIAVSPRLQKCGPRWRAKVELTVTGVTARQATLTWSWPGERAHSLDATPDSGGRFTTTIAGLPRGKPVSFQGSALSAANVRGESGIVTQEVPRCKEGDARSSKHP